MATLTIIPEYYQTAFKIKGLSFKKLKGSNVGHDLIIDDDKRYVIDKGFNHDGRTCQIKPEILLEYVRELHTYIPFDNIKIIGHYEKTAEELMKQITCL